MIDVFCVLLIFFIVATTFRKNVPVVKISLPEAKAGVSVNQTEPVIISVTADEKISLDGKELSHKKLGEMLTELGKKSPQPIVALQADKKASYGLIIKIMDAAKTAGFGELQSYIEPEPQGTKEH